MLIISNFIETSQFSKTLFNALSWKPRPILRRAFRDVIAKKWARLNNGHISFNRFVIVRWNSICRECGETLSKNAFARSKKLHLEPKLTPGKPYTAACQITGITEKVLIYRRFLVILRRGLRNDTPDHELKALRTDCIKQFSVLGRMFNQFNEASQVGFRVLSDSELSIRTVFAEIPQYKAIRVH